MKIDDFRLKLGKKEFVPIVIGGMGVNISTTELALEAARLGGIGHISDALVPTVVDQCYHTHFVMNKLKRYQSNIGNRDKSKVHFDLEELAKAQRLYVSKTMEAKQGEGDIFINCMEKLLMNDPLGTLRTRLTAAMDAGIDGITLSAGLNLRSLELMQDHPRFHDVKIGIIVSSVRALTIFLRRASRVRRLPDYIIVEGPLAGGHLGFGVKDWHRYNLKEIVREVLNYLKAEDLKIPVIPAGGVFTGTDGVDFLQMGAAALQVATRFTVTDESGLPDDVKQKYLEAEEQDVVVNSVSPTGYPMRMLKQTPALSTTTKPNCEALGYILDSNGNCTYNKAYYDAYEKNPEGKIIVKDKVCLCLQMKTYRCWTCGHNVYRLKDTTRRLPDNSYQLLTAEHVFRDYQFSEDHQIQLPASEDSTK
ncbi:MAG: nitronate monooxygenase [Deltaproteobacteria bacterium]|nr:nitronate monooxygenase [Deltaproteobacteria bacterium]